MLSGLAARLWAWIGTIIARNYKPLAKLLPARDRVPGRLAGRISWTPDAFDPLTDQELSDLGFE
jgi:hypothetical protein